MTTQEMFEALREDIRRLEEKIEGKSIKNLPRRRKIKNDIEGESIFDLTREFGGRIKFKVRKV